MRPVSAPAQYLSFQMADAATGKAARLDEIIAMGCDICAVGHDKYVLGEIEVLDAETDGLDPRFDPLRPLDKIAGGLE
ncbi:hypothetical protein I6F07_07760 [Ensifer sp. IC4062]|nr:hypothetical protein [Ensifer sp. IC4062]MCA1440121.1 hypothetical protein [Ensifer sp. IC4062]